MLFILQFETLRYQVILKVTKTAFEIIKMVTIWHLLKLGSTEDRKLNLFLWGIQIFNKI